MARSPSGKTQHAAHPPDGAAANGEEIVARDERRRGWWWQWNSVHTQAGPLLGHVGVGLLDYYIVMTDRRPESPRFGYAYVSLDSISVDYGIERGELIAINKILETLELISKSKEMVSRPSDDGKHYRTQINLYRIVDRADGYDLTTADVLKVVRLAGESETIYRRIRHIFRSRFPLLDLEGVWARMLPELRQDPLWQTLAARALEEEARASERSRKGHANRKGGFDASDVVDEAASAETENDTGSVIATVGEQTAVAGSNAGSASGVAKSNPGVTTDFEPSNGGSAPLETTVVAGSNGAAPTGVEPSNTTYHVNDSSTTTTSGGGEIDEANDVSRTPVTAPERVVNGFGEENAPGDGPAEALAVRNFEEANSRPASPFERRRLVELAARFDPAARAQSRRGTGWRWVAEAIAEGVESGSGFMAPRRIETILTRWTEEGAPERAGGGVRPAVFLPAPEPEPEPNAEPEPTAPIEPPPLIAKLEPAAPFLIEECGLPSLQMWDAVQEDLVAAGQVTAADRRQLLRPSRLIGRGPRGELIVSVATASAKRKLDGSFNRALREACAPFLGREVELIVRVGTEPERQARAE